MNTTDMQREVYDLRQKVTRLEKLVRHILDRRINYENSQQRCYSKDLIRDFYSLENAGEDYDERDSEECDERY